WKQSMPVTVGEVGPIAASNPMQQPFSCQTFETVLGQPVVDNYMGDGFPVTDPGGPKWSDYASLTEDDIIGYSANCGAPTEVVYYYSSTSSGEFEKLADVNNVPADVEMIPLGDMNVPFIVRQEIGTINRFIYSIY